MNVEIILSPVLLRHFETLETNNFITICSRAHHWSYPDRYKSSKHSDTQRFQNSFLCFSSTYVEVFYVL